MENFIEKYRIFIAADLSGMGNEGKVALRQAWGSPYEFDSKEAAYQWIADNPEQTRNAIEFFVLPYIRRQY